MIEQVRERQTETVPSAIFKSACWLLLLAGFGLIVSIGFAIVTLSNKPRIVVNERVVEIPIVQEVEVLVPATDSPPSIEERARSLGMDYEEIVRDALKEEHASLRKGTVLSSPPITSETTAEGMDPVLKEKLYAAKVLRRKGDLARAMLALEAGLDEHSEEPALLYELGLAYENLRNFRRAREIYLQLFKMGSEAGGEFFIRAGEKLSHGFADPVRYRGKLGFGSIIPRHQKLEDGTEELILRVPVEITPGLEVDPADLKIAVDFYDRVGRDDIESTVGVLVEERWLHEPVNWEDGEEILQLQWRLPPLSKFEREIVGERTYYGFVAKIYYKGEPMDAFASPRNLFLIRKSSDSQFLPMDEDFLRGGLLPSKNEIDLDEFEHDS